MRYKGHRIPTSRNLIVNSAPLFRYALIVCAWGFSISAMAQTSTFRFTEKPGPYAAGLKVVEQYDRSRVYRALTDSLGQPFKGERARPLQTLVWYPAKASSGKAMTVGDYVDLLATETTFDSPEPAVVKSYATSLGKSLAEPLWALRDAAPTTGKFPVVIYAPSFSSSAWENADLCEFLASYGYVVISSPDMGVVTRTMSSDVAGINAQAADISFLIGYAAGLPNTDLSEVAVAGWSWGGISNLFAAARDNRIKALVDLDGSVRYFPGLLKKAGDIHPEQMTLPLLFFAQGEITLENQAQNFIDPDNAGPSALNAWTHGDLLMVEMLGLSHAEFSSMFQRQPVWKHFEENKKGDYGREDGIAGYAWVARYTLNFLDAYLKHDTAAASFLKNTPAANGVPAHLMTAHFRAAKGTPANLDSFRAELGRQGFDHAAGAYAAMKKAQPDFSLGEDLLNTWGFDLMTHGHLQQSIEIFKLTVQEYPHSSAAFENLGQAYALAKQKSLATQALNTALTLDPANTEASDQLKKLQ